MTIALTINGATFNYPETDDVDWGGAATAWASAVTSGMLQKAGGSFVLLSELDFGPGFGVSSLYIKSRSADLAEAGFIRLAQTDSINFRNEENSADLALGVNSSDQLTFQGEPLQSFLSFTDTATIDLVNSFGTVSAAIKNESITDAEISPTAAISVNKLESLPAGNIIVGDYQDIPTSMPVTGDVLLTHTGETYINNNVILDADINGNAKINVSKLADGSVSNTEFQYLNNVNYNIQEQFYLINGNLYDHITEKATHGVTGDIVGTTDTQALSNKTISASTISTSTFSDSAKLTEISTPSTPDSGIVDLYAKADGNIYKKASDGIEELVNAGGVSYEEATITLTNSGVWELNGTLNIVRINKLVTISGPSLTHTLNPGAISAAGVIPAQFRPLNQARNVYTLDSAGVRVFFVHTDGSIQTTYRAWDGSTFSLESTSQYTISYLLT